MWTVDATQHIHVEPSVPEREVLERATAVASLSASGQVLCVDLIAVEGLACACGQPSHWKTYQVILYAPASTESSERPS